jgi:hypothetical protein
MALVDTGSSLIGLPKDLAQKYYHDHVPGATRRKIPRGDGPPLEMWVYPCSVQLPEFSVYVNGNMVTVPGKRLKRGEWNNGLCEGNIQNGPQDRFILGHPFFWSEFVVFDFRWSKARIGFAQQRG